MKIRTRILETSLSISVVCIIITVIVFIAFDNNRYAAYITGGLCIMFCLLSLVISHVITKREEQAEHHQDDIRNEVTTA